MRIDTKGDFAPRWNVTTAYNVRHMFKSDLKLGSGSIDFKNEEPLAKDKKDSRNQYIQTKMWVQELFGRSKQMNDARKFNYPAKSPCSFNVEITSKPVGVESESIIGYRRNYSISEAKNMFDMQRSRSLGRLQSTVGNDFCSITDA